MKTINTLTQEKIKFTLFPDNQPHVDLEDINPGDEVHVITRLYTANHVLHLLEITNVLNRLGAIKSKLTITYLMAARYDRCFKERDSFDLKVIADLINSCEFQEVAIFDAHSKTAFKLIKNSHSFGAFRLLREYNKQGSVLILPDRGACDKTWQSTEFQNHGNLFSIVTCDKKRDAQGTITMKVLNPEKCQGKDCIIVDDICDGGATFILIALQINPRHLTLAVSHGIFSKGTNTLFSYFDEIITTDSLPQEDEHVTVRNLWT